MGVQKNASYKVHNGVDFDEINFKTIASQVKTANGSDVEVQLAEKVNKTIQTFKPTLINGWVNYTNWNANYGDLIFYKDDMGIVHIEGTLTGGTTAYPFVLPAGFRPSKNILATASALQGTSGSTIVPLQAVIEKDSGNFGLFGWNTSLSRVAINISFKLI